MKTEQAMNKVVTLIITQCYPFRNDLTNRNIRRVLTFTRDQPSIVF